MIVIDKKNKPVKICSKDAMPKFTKGSFISADVFKLSTNALFNRKKYYAYLIQKKNKAKVVIKEKGQILYSAHYDNLQDAKDFLRKYVNVEKLIIKILPDDAVKTTTPATTEEERKENITIKDFSEANTSCSSSIGTILPVGITPSFHNATTVKASDGYRYKFYLDANHYVSIDGKNGKIHPHTWEVVIEMVNKKGDFVRFSEVEKAINEILKPFQLNCLNDIEPFTKINPSTENLGKYLKQEIQKKLNPQDWEVLQLEISESANRAYIVSSEEDFLDIS